MDRKLFKERKQEAKRILKRESLTQVEVADRMGVSKSYAKLVLDSLVKDGSIIPSRRGSVVYYAYPFRIPPRIRPALWISGFAIVCSFLFPAYAEYFLTFLAGVWACTIWESIGGKR